MRAFVKLLTIVAAIIATAPASAALYKWVDQSGVTNYSSEPPADPASAKKALRVEGTLSVYTPDESFMQAVQAMRQQRIQALYQPEPSPTRNPVATLQSPSPYEQCLASGRTGCESLYDGYFPSAYLPGVVVFQRRIVHPPRFHAATVPFGGPRMKMPVGSMLRQHASRGVKLR